MILFTTGCEDDDHDHDEDHTDADGFILEDESGTEVYREFEGAMTGTVTLAVGETLELSVHFLDHEGNEIEHEEGEEEEEHDDELVVSENDASVAVVEVEDHEEGEEEHHEMALHVVGVSTGSTSFKLQLMHEGHADYTSTNNVPVTVN
jgi:activator of 2-hydroxyglutaryl-CoA dehydratase|tara:strand:- start:1830 stop:2276 length:447 start_codon:yes stop_codon:yes gene_type:complete